MNIYRLHSNPNELKQVNSEKVLHSKGVRNNKIDRNLNLKSTPITSLPDNLTVGGSLYLIGTQYLDKNNLPSSLVVKGDIIK